MTDRPFEYDRHDDNDEPYPIEYDRFFIFFFVGVNMFVGVNEYVSAVGFGQGPSPGSQARTGWDTLLAPLLRYSTRKKISGTEVRRTPDEMTNQVGRL